MTKPTLLQIHVELEKHIVVAEERWIETIARIKRIENIMIGSAGTTIVLLLTMLIRG